MTTILKHTHSETLANKPGDLEPGQVAVNSAYHSIYVGNASNAKELYSGGVGAPAPTAGKGWIEYKVGKSAYAPVVDLTTDRTLGLDDDGCHFHSSGSANITVTFPADATQNFDIGSEFWLSRRGTGTYSIATPVTIDGDTSDLAVGELAYVKKIASDTYEIWRITASSDAYNQEQVLAGAGGTVAWDANNGAVARTTLSATTTYALSNFPLLPSGTFLITQDATGGHEIALTGATLDHQPCKVPARETTYKAITTGAGVQLIRQNFPNIEDVLPGTLTQLNQVGDVFDITAPFFVPASSDAAYQYQGELYRTDTFVVVQTQTTTPNAVIPGTAGSLTFTSVDTVDGVTPLTFRVRFTAIC